MLMPNADASIVLDTPTGLESQGQAPVIVVGGGPVGMRCATILSRQNIPVVVLSAEPYQPYNRVRLTPLLGGDVQFGEIAIAPPKVEGFSLQVGQTVKRVNREDKTLVTADGRIWSYDKLILAIGSNAFVPAIPGADLSGVFTFRTAVDTSALLARSISARHVVVIGGGLLGLEAARGMRKHGAKVTVVEHESRLMPRQLDLASGEILAEKIRELGVDVRTGVAVRHIQGSHKVERIELADGTFLDTDTVIICTGVRPNIELAKGAGLAFSRGIVVNDQMRTSDPDIYAVGECTEHAGRVYGLVGPGYAQADVAAAQIVGDTAVFQETSPTTKLKVIGADVFSAGEIETLEAAPGIRSHVWSDGSNYRRVFIDRGKLVGALAVGKWEQANRVQDAVQANATVYPWMVYRFRRSGDIWSDAPVSVDEMSDDSIICNCTEVSCGQLRKARDCGHKSVPALGLETGAGTVCGSCHPLLEELLDSGAPPKPVRHWQTLLGLSGLATLGALIPILLGAVPLPSSYDAESLRVWLWRDNIVKQWSGFILLAVTLGAFVIGLRKRIRFFDRLGSYDIWRLVHLVIGGLALAGFAAHTGFSLGSNLNLWLAFGFLATIGLGALSGLATGGDHELRARQIGSARKPFRRIPVWLHILVVWPLPVLITVHVLASYAF
jgi:nitrite reductase (NADH) large subunit